MKTCIVVIGRNEGGRLVACIESLLPSQFPIVYVDSGSSDDSVQNAKNLGADVIALDMSIPFTAARARNAGIQRINEKWPQFKFVQFVDGDCVVVGSWLGVAEAFLDEHDDVAIVSGRVREINPEVTVYNALCDIEWDTSIGEVTQCGGIVMMRISAFFAVGGFRAEMIAGEEPELCLRLRERGWKIWHLPVDMALHDADIKNFGQWWRRALRGGFAYAMVFALHVTSPKRIWHREVTRAIFWGFLLPLAILGVSFLHFHALWLLLLYPLQVARLAIRRDANDAESWRYGIFLTIAKFAEAMGVLKYLVSRLRM